MRRSLLLTLLTVAAFFCGRAQSGYALLMEDGGSLTVCNNVVVNNGEGASNVTAANNLFGQYPIFANAHTDFHIVHPEYVFNLGSNACTTWLYDMMGIFRQYNDTIDLGAYECPRFVNFAVFQDYEGTLSFCNNVIINNFSGENLNVEVTADNYLTDGTGVFVHDQHNFCPKEGCALVNAGNNGCASLWVTDISGDERVQRDTVDIGAYECRFREKLFPVYRETGGSLSFCNNIIINNHADSNVNVAVSAYNFVTNSELVFLHDFANFITQPQSVTVNAGDNGCVSGIGQDLFGEERVVNYTVDMGAFEIRYDRAYYSVYQEDGGGLHICNNIIMNNHADTNVNVTVEDNNFVTDSADIFVNPYINFRSKAQIPTLDAGQNSCAAGIDSDLAGDERVQNGTVDIGAYEYRPLVVSYPVLKEGSGDMHFCNNIIINNYADTNINVTVDAYNLVQNVAGVFNADYSLFRLADSSAAINAGSNVCMEDTTDLTYSPRVENEIIDLGAFERRIWPRQFGVYQDAGGSLSFCNNIFVNNHSADSNVNVAAVPHNLFHDNDYVFADKYQNYKLLSGSAAIDAGLNNCLEWERDLADTTRVLHEVVDLGAFETYVDDQRAVVFQDSGSTLTLCNNVIILNSEFVPNTNFTPVPSSNIINDLVEVFRDNLLDFRPAQYSDAVDAGDNGCNGLPTDLDTVKRISNGRIDIGAFEIPVLYDTNYAGGGGGGGGGYSGGGGGYSGGGGGYMDPDYNGIVCENSTASLYLCNNIIVNNRFAVSTNTYYGLDSLYCNLIHDTVPLFREASSDFRLIAVSPAVNRGRGGCNLLSKDIAKHDRVIQDTIDIGAFEYEPAPDYVAVMQVEGHQMNVCNNIIINNFEAFSVNDLNTPGNNLLIDNNLVFRNNELNYVPRPGSAAVNHGTNDCNPLAVDLKDAGRIYADTIDIGAFEITVFSDSDIFVVFGKEGHQLNLCNNIIINNSGTNPVNDEEVSAYNLLVDHHDVFIDNELDYTPRENSIVINVGNNDCCQLDLDLSDVGRIYADTIDLGAFEQYVQSEDSVLAVLQHDGHTLTLCNNIIVNNPLAVSTNAQVDGEHNILAAGDDLFVDSQYDYTPRPNSAAVNAGDNLCCDLSSDLCEKSRIYEEVIDIGAFEPRVVYDTAIALFGEEGTDWTLCNNIIINNKYSINLNISGIPANNIVVDNDTLFVDNHYNYRLRPDAIAVNAGDNGCVGWVSDLEANVRIFDEIVDIGAFEQYIDTQKLITVLQLDSVALVLCNNIIANNPYSLNINIGNVPDNNIIEDYDSIFIDQRYDYRPRLGSVAIDHGSNDCATWPLDMVTKDRVFADIVDIGAYEVRTADTVELVAVNGDIPPFSGSDDGQSGIDTTGGGSSGDTIANALKLRMYNNIVIHNEGTTMNVGGDVIGDHNLWDDTPGVFVNEQDNYVLLPQSPAVDAGDNQWVTWPLDIKDDPRIACGNVVDQGAFELTFDTLNTSLIAMEVPTDNCQGYYIQLTATPGAMHYIWSHSNEDTNAVQVSPLLPTEYTVIATNGGECVDTATVYVIPSALMADSLGAPASVGKTFYLSYLRNHFHDPTLTLNISAEEACMGTVSNPQTGWSTNFSVGDHSVTTVSVPLPQAYSPESDVVGNFGILVETTDSVSVYAANYNPSSFDVTDVLPVEALSDEYVLQTYKPMMNAEFVIVATMDNTQVDITPSRALIGGHAAQHTFTVTLQAGQTYIGLSQYGGVLGDLSGTVIKAHDNKPIAVFNGNVCALVPSDNSYTDHLVEQAIGVKYWGKSFAISTTESQNFDVVRVTALRDNTEIRKNGVLMTTIQAFQTYEFQLTGAEGSCYLETSEPAGVYLYIAGAVQGNPQERSDPSMVWIPPTEQMLTDITFATFNSPGITDHYVNIVVPADALNEVTLDGVNIGGQFVPLTGNPAYAYARKHIANGTHRLHCGGGFIAHCYGLGFHESYGYAAGSKAVPLKEQLFVNGILNTELPSDTKFCPYEPIEFSTYVNYPCDSVVWNFGDSTPTVNGFTATHGYAEAGTYIVSATLYITSNGAVFCSNLYVRIKVVAAPTVTYYDSVCQGQGYQQYGFDVPPADAGHYTYTRNANAGSSYCDSLYVLELEVLDNYLILEDTICLGNAYTDNGFDITPVETGFYTDTIVAGVGANGCDSLVILQLSVTPNTDNPPAIEGEGWPCQGGTYTYAIDSLSGLQDVVWTVPDSLIVMPGENPYSVTLLFGVYADSMEICVTATGGCGVLNWCRTVWPQPYNYVQIFDTLCDNVTEYARYGFELTDVSDSNDLFIRHDTAAGGCDSTTVLRLIFLPTYEVLDTLAVCGNDFPYLYHDTLLADTGTYLITLPTQEGCDSAVALTVLRLPVQQIDIDTTVCDQMVWYGKIYTESGSYDTTFVNGYGCDSTLVLHLTVNRSDTVTADSTVCRSELPLVWNGLTFNDAGVQTAVLTNGYSCDSAVVMTLVVNEASAETVTVTVLENSLPYQLNGYSYPDAGTYTQNLTNVAGCDSVLTIVLNVLSNVTNSADSIICEGALPFTWNGVTFTQADTLVAMLTASTGADSLLAMNVSVIPTTYGTFDTAGNVNALPMLYNDSLYTMAGTYTQNLTNAASCDSILTLHIDVMVDLDSAVCETAIPFTWNDSVFTEAGVKETTIPAATGADSTITMTVTVIPTTYSTFDTAIVENALPFHYNDSVYEEAGTYTQILSNAAGCDSVLTLILTVFPNVTSELDSTICESALPFLWNDSVFMAAGTKTTTILASTGADSTITMVLTVIPPVTELVEVTACESYDWNDSTYTFSGDYIQTFTAATGCDSIVTLHLTINHGTHNIETATACESFDWHDTTYTESGAYTYEYTNESGCESADTLHLVIIPLPELSLCSDTSIVAGSSASLWASGADYYQWLPAEGLSDPNSATPLASPSQSTCYQVTGYAAPAEQDNVVMNGGFEAGYSSFTTDYNYVANPSHHSLGSGNFVINEDAHNVWPLQHQYGYGGDGLFMIVDGASSPNATVWSQTVNVQPNTSYDFSAQIVSLCASDISVARLQFVVNGVQLGPVFEASSTLYQWMKFHNLWYSGDTTVATITILNQNTNGQGNDFGLDDIVFAPMIECSVTDSVCVSVYYSVIDSMAICVTELPYEWNGVTFEHAGTLQTVLQASNGADSTITMTLTVIPTTYGTFDTAVNVNALPMLYNDSFYTMAGTYTQNLTTAEGCDSILTLQINVMVEVDSAVCEGGFPIVWNGVEFVAAGTDSVLLSAAGGADSLVVMTVTEIPTTYGTVTLAVVENALPYHYNDSVYAEAGTYTQYLTNVAGCDSVLTVVINVFENVTAFVDSIVCEGELPVLWNDSVFTEAGTKTTTILSTDGADSTVVMTLTVIPTTYSAFDTAVVENALPFSYNDSTYFGAGAYTQNLTNVAGCDSILTITLTVFPNVTSEIDSIVCESELPLIWNDSIFTEAGVKITTIPAHTGADSTITMTLTVVPTTYGTFDTAIVENALPFSYNDSAYAEAGTYTQYFTNAAGCDSILTVSLTVFPNVTADLDSAVCESAFPFTWNDSVFTEAGTKTTTIPAHTGADSTITMTVTMVPTTYGTFDTAIVENALPFHYNDSTYTAAGTYTQYLTNAEGCDSILTLQINVMVEVDSAVCEGGFPIVWNGVEFVAAGTDSVLLSAAGGADSLVVMTVTEIPTTYGTVTLAVVENALPYHYNDSVYAEAGTYTQYLTNVAGCDSVLTVVINVFENVTAFVDSIVCEGELPVLWNDSVFTEAGTKTTTILSTDGADSTVVMTLTVIPTTYSAFDTAVVENALPFSYNDSTYFGAGAYTQNLTNVAGCDSILTITLTVFPNVTSEIDSIVCESELPLIWNDSIFTEAGVKITTIPAHTGADSTITMTLTVVPTTYGTFDTAIVENALPFSYNDSAYAEAGTYTQYFTNAAGCDSILTVSLTVFPNVTADLDSAVCESAFPFTWNDSVFTEAGTKTTTIPAHTGADSTITMTVTMVPTTYGTFDTAIVENALPFHYNDSTYTAAGTYTQYLTNAEGCDSILTFTLTVHPNVTGEDDSTICASELPLLWNGVTFTAAGAQTATLLAANGADSVVTMTLHVNALSYSIIDTTIIQNSLPFHYINGQIDTTFAVGTPQFSSTLFTYTNTLGCDSVVTLNLTVYQNVTTAVDTTVCAADLPYTWHGHSFAAAGNHTVTLQTSHEADSTVTYQLSVDNITSDIGNITHITCYGESTGAATATVIGGQVPMTYQWTNASGTSVSTTTSVGNRPADTYTFTVTDHLGCTATATVTFNTLNGELTPGTIADNQVVCDGEDIPTFTGTAASGGDNGAYQWQLSTNGTDWTPAPGTNNAQTYTYPNPAAAAFTLRRAWVSQSCGTVYSNVVTVEVAPNSSDTITAEVCQGEPYQENGFVVTADQTAVAGEYTYEQHYATGHCDSAVILLLTVWPEVVELVEATVCEGDGYSGNGFEVSPLETVGVGELQREQTLQTVHGCDSVVTLQLTVIDTALHIELLTEDFCEHQEAALSVVSSMPDYVWSTGETATTIVVSSPGLYSVTATEDGCSATAHIRVEGCQYELVLPNAITPSLGDGVNDCFFIPENFTANINLFKIYIFNRWGELVFYSTDKNFRWYGDYRGVTQYQTIYNYVIEYTDTAGRPFRRTGSITVL